VDTFAGLKILPLMMGLFFGPLQISGKPCRNAQGITPIWEDEPYLLAWQHHLRHLTSIPVLANILQHRKHFWF
jgi:hypothetical protein